MKKMKPNEKCSEINQQNYLDQNKHFTEVMSLFTQQKWTSFPSA